ncbi:ropporin-1-like protein [Rhopilema esculentum]|uniref:ropporin-1-like protein n=1 Tax=Rhopilema esculentum TaxID=499914 RepID=UPI0031DDC2D6|eukprot:gene3678-14941_t
MTSTEPMYCSQQIKIPPELPNILKQFTKAAIRTQPKDVLQWSAAYFDALNKGEQPPVKERLDYKLGQPLDNPVTKGALAVLHKQLGNKPVVELCKVEEKWNALCLPKTNLDEVMRLGSFGEEFNWLQFLALACSTINSNLTSTMQTICDMITKDLEGGPSRISFKKFKLLYTYLAEVDGDISAEHVASVLEHLSSDADRQQGKVGPGNFMNDACPRLAPESS